MLVGRSLSVMASKKVIVMSGLGYVGLPLVFAFGEHRSTLWFCIKQASIIEPQQSQGSSLQGE
jgi:UDP-N-acetyl-D-mannosaminuronate dehydrogenase